MTWSIANYNSFPSGNTNINGINIAEGCAASGINDAIRQLMADLAAYFGTAGAFAGTLAVTGATTIGGALTYGGVTLTNAVTGTGKMVLSAGPTFTGTTSFAAINAAGNITTSVGNISTANGNVLVPGGAFNCDSGGGANCSVSGFGATMTMGFSGISSNAPGGSNIDCVAQGSGGVRLPSGATSWTALSDETLKTQFTPFANALDKAAGIKSGTGRYLTDPESVSRSFLSAQSVQAVLPEAVSVRTAAEGHEDPLTGTLMLSYTDVIPLLVAALAEARARIVALEVR